MRSIGSKLALAAGSVLFSLLFSEIALRAYYVQSSTGYLADLEEDRDLPPPNSDVTLGHLITLSPNPDIIYIGRPAASGFLEGIHVRINREGWREDPIPFDKPSDEFRIVGIGDSVMYGMGVEENERYLDVLEATLNQEFPERRWRTVALAIPGYNLMIEVEVLREVGLRYDPDLILYGYVGNDVCLPRFVADKKSVLSTDSFIAHYVRQQFSPQAEGIRRGRVVVRASREPRASSERLGSCRNDGVPERYRHLAGEQSLKDALVKLAAISRETEIPAIILFDGRRGEPNPMTPNVPESIPIIDLHEHFQRYYQAHGLESYEHPSLRLGGESGPNHHPTALGHHLIAEGIFDALVENKLVP